MGIETGAAEVVASSADASVPITSGGGFSTTHYPPATYSVAAPSHWQAAQLQAYTRAHPDAVPAAAAGGDARGYPDVAMAGHAFQVVDHGKVRLVSGTSAAAPVFAGMVAALVAERRAAGADGGYFYEAGLLHESADASGIEHSGDKHGEHPSHPARLGWLNPTLYAARARAGAAALSTSPTATTRAAAASAARRAAPAMRRQRVGILPVGLGP